MGKIHFGPFLLDVDEALLFKGNERIGIRPQALQVLIYLVKNEGKVISRKEISNLLWPENYVDEEQGLNVVMRTLRQTLDDNSKAPKYIETIPTRGYRFIKNSKHVSPFALMLVSKLQQRTTMVLGLIAVLMVFAGMWANEQKEFSGLTINDLSSEARAAYTRGISLYENYKYMESALLFEKLVGLEPNFAEGYYWLAKSVDAEGYTDLETALEVQPYLMRAIELKPDYEDALVRLGRIKLITSLDTSIAMDFAQQALDLNPQNVDALALKGLSHLASGDTKSSLDYMDQVNNQDPLELFPMALEGWILFMDNDLEAAAANCQLALEVGAMIESARNCLYETYLAMNEPELALQQAIEIMISEGATRSEIQDIKESEVSLGLENYLLWRESWAASVEDTFALIVINLRLGKKDAAAKYLKKIADEREYPSILFIASDPRIKELLTYPGLQEVFDLYKT